MQVSPSSLKRSLQTILLLLHAIKNCEPDLCLLSFCSHCGLNTEEIQTQVRNSDRVDFGRMKTWVITRDVVLISG